MIAGLVVGAPRRSSRRGAEAQRLVGHSGLKHRHAGCPKAQRILDVDHHHEVVAAGTVELAHDLGAEQGAVEVHEVDRRARPVRKSGLGPPLPSTQVRPIGADHRGRWHGLGDGDELGEAVRGRPAVVLDEPHVAQVGASRCSNAAAIAAPGPRLSASSSTVMPVAERLSQALHGPVGAGAVDHDDLLQRVRLRQQSPHTLLGDVRAAVGPRDGGDAPVGVHNSSVRGQRRRPREGTAVMATRAKFRGFVGRARNAVQASARARRGSARRGPR